MRNQRRAGRAVAGAATLLTLIMCSCSIPAVPGSTYLAIDWVYAPEALYFREFPQIITTGEYVEHDAGSYYGEYIAWDGSYWTVDYTIEVDEGEDGTLLFPADDGDDHYLTLWLYSFGPSIYTDEIVSHSVVAVDDEERRFSGIGQLGSGSARLVEARERAAITEPLVFTAECREGRVTVLARFERYGTVDSE